MLLISLFFLTLVVNDRITAALTEWEEVTYLYHGSRSTVVFFGSMVEVFANLKDVTCLTTRRKLLPDLL